MCGTHRGRPDLHAACQPFLWYETLVRYDRYRNLLRLRDHFGGCAVRGVRGFTVELRVGHVLHGDRCSSLHHSDRDIVFLSWLQRRHRD